jgi:hypothetical protein
MSNSYVVQTVFQNPLTDVLTVTGTVNGVAVTVQTWVSAAPLASAIAFESFIAPLMLAQYNALTAPTAVAAVQGISFTK